MHGISIWEDGMTDLQFKIVITIQFISTMAVHIIIYSWVIKKMRRLFFGDDK